MEIVLEDPASDAAEGLDSCVFDDDSHRNVKNAAGCTFRFSTLVGHSVAVVSSAQKALPGQEELHPSRMRRTLTRYGSDARKPHDVRLKQGTTFCMHTVERFHLRSSFSI